MSPNIKEGSQRKSTKRSRTGSCHRLAVRQRQQPVQVDALRCHVLPLLPGALVPLHALRDDLDVASGGQQVYELQCAAACHVHPDGEQHGDRTDPVITARNQSICQTGPVRHKQRQNAGRELRRGQDAGQLFPDVDPFSLALQLIRERVQARDEHIPPAVQPPDRKVRGELRRVPPEHQPREP